jgi:hypothetical protein
MTNLINAIKMNERTTTVNGDLAYTTTGTPLLDYVGLIGGMRNSSDSEILNLWEKAFQENRITAMQLLFYTRDVPNRGGGGLGERRIFYVIMKHLILNHKDLVYKVARFIPEYGYWKDIKNLAKMCYEMNELEIAQDFISFQAYMLFTNPDQLVAKYSVDENEKDSAFKEFALNHICNTFNITRRFYRKNLVSVRKGVVERLMSDKAWSEINYSQVPSKAAKIYRNAFVKHDGLRYNRFIAEALTGETKINSGTLNPVELVMTLHRGNNNTIEAQWRQLPNYVDENINAIVMADVSGSMNGTPIQVCISLAIYFAERNKGHFANHFLTFSSKSKLVALSGKTLFEKYYNLNKTEWGMSTNIDSAFETILNAAVRHNVPVHEMPSVILIITDGQFNSQVQGGTAFERIEQKYRNAGYELPHIVFWNVNVLKPTLPALSSRFVTLVSGYSSSVLTSVFNKIKNVNQNVIDAILATGRYDQIAEALS